MKMISVSKAKRDLKEVLSNLSERVVLIKNDEAIAVIMGIDDYRCMQHLAHEKLEGPKQLKKAKKLIQTKQLSSDLLVDI